ncbi:hypothetical protein [Paracidovorax wautersii]|uniref:hypothetical protein n=1 Tax=Paracidovorax wautersii TaxID=1177982 RepID=UPI0031DA8990
MKKTTKAITTADAPIDQERFAADMETMRSQAAGAALAVTQQNERVTALALQLNYTGSTDPAVLENSAKDAIRRIGMAVFELGGYLLLLKDGCKHGEFTSVLERLKLEERAARQYMQVTKRFSNRQTSADLSALGVSKLTEMLVLDDEQLEELTEVGQTGELALDDIAGMSVRELRTAARKARAEAEKHKARAERQEAVNAELHEEVRLIKRLPPAEELKRVLKEAGDIQAELLGVIQGGLRQALIALNNAEQDQSLHMAGMVGQALAELTALREEFNLPTVDTTPEWERWAQAHPVDATATPAKAN